MWPGVRLSVYRKPVFGRDGRPNGSSLSVKPEGGEGCMADVETPLSLVVFWTDLSRQPGSVAVANRVVALALSRQIALIALIAIPPIVFY